MNHHLQKKNATVYPLVFTGMMAALVFAATYLKIDIPLPGGKTMVSLGNSMCILSGLLLGPVYGGLSAGIGSFCFDLTDALFIAESPITFLFKFIMGFVCGLISKGGRQKKVRLSRYLVAAVSGSVAYMILYLLKSFVRELLNGSAIQAALAIVGTKSIASAANAVMAVAIAVPLFLALRQALKSSHMWDKVHG